MDGSPGGSNQIFMKNPAIISHYEGGNYDGGNHHSRLPNPSIAPDVMNQKFQKVYERLGFIEDSLSRVEL